MNKTQLNYQKQLKEFIEPPISKDERSNSKLIREMLKNKEFDKLYTILPKDIAIIINNKYRTIDFS